ncbi:MAG: methionyl-tRNA formyltransferase [Candidatus Spechtbacterales bacterium]
MKNKSKIIFFGTPKFADIILKELIAADYKPCLIVTAPDKPVGRKQELVPPATKITAKKHGIEVWQPEKLEIGNWKLEINKLGHIDFAVVAAYGKIIPKEILDTLKNRFANIHPSLLPKWRGPSPVHSALLHGDTTTGSTIILLDEKMDHGPILAQEALKISETDTTESLTEKLAIHGAKVLIKTIPDWTSGKIKSKEQDHNSASYTKIITREDGRVDWHESAPSLERRLRAFTPWPGLFTYWEEKRLKILSLDTEKNEQKINPGQVVQHKNIFAIQTGRGLVLPREVQLEGGKPMEVKEFLKGHPGIIGVQLL